MTVQRRLHPTNRKTTRPGTRKSCTPWCVPILSRDAKRFVCVIVIRRTSSVRRRTTACPCCVSSSTTPSGQTSPAGYVGDRGRLPSGTTDAVCTLPTMTIPEACAACGAPLSKGSDPFSAHAAAPRGRSSNSDLYHVRQSRRTTQLLAACTASPLV